MRVNMLIADELVKKVDKEANNLCVTRTSYINMALAQHFATKETAQNMPAVLADLKEIMTQMNELKNALPESKS